MRFFSGLLDETKLCRPRPAVWLLIALACFGCCFAPEAKSGTGDRPVDRACRDWSAVLCRRPPVA